MLLTFFVLLCTIGSKNYSSCANALQSSSSFPQSPRGPNTAYRYLDEGHPFTFGYLEGHPFTYDPTNRMEGPTDGAAPDYRYYPDSNRPLPLEEIDDVQVRRQRSTSRRRSGLALGSLSGSSMLPTRRRSQIVQSTPSPPDLLTFEEEIEITADIQRFQRVTRTLDYLSDWMAREHYNQPSEYQWASACSLSIDELHDIMARGQEAGTKLIEGNVGLVTMIAKRYYSMLGNGEGRSSGGGGAGGTDATLKLDDLVQEGYMGIMAAAERFDPSKGCRFSTYGTHWVKQRILRAIAEHSRTIRLPVHVQTMIRNMHKKQKELELRIGRPPSAPELAHEMGVRVDKIQLYQQFPKSVLSLELPVDRHSNTEDKRTIGDCVASTEMASPDEDFFSESLKGEVHAMLDALNSDERLILTHRFGLVDGRPKSLRETAEAIGVPSDLVRTVEATALNKLRQPRMSYRLKEYVGGEEVFEGGLDYSEPSHYNGAQHNGVAVTYMEEQQHPYFHHNPHRYPHHMNNGESLNNDIERDDDLREYERPSPENIWGF